MKKKDKARVAARMAEYRRSTRRVPTPDNWSPTADDGCVSVSVIDMGGTKPMIRTCVWGEDDFGMERDEFFDSVSAKNRAYEERVREVGSWGMVSMKMLQDLGFVGA